ncbi:MAG TPA: MoaD/ThiS family protein [Anaerovoracaceae bacterium]|nr:MoaD/ThiS family protein [Anaerovoracaceae bacterium]
MEVKVKFIGVLSVKYGPDPILIDLGPGQESLLDKIQELIGNHGAGSYFILINGRPAKFSDPIEDGDVLTVFSPISGG